MKILFASMPLDGHFNPLTPLAVHLRERGHDVRFYTGPGYADRLAELGIPHVPFQRARDVNGENLVEHYPEYEKLGTGPKAIEFAATRIFFGNVEAHLKDVEALRSDFAFEAMVCDAAFYASYPIAKKLALPVYAVMPAPTPAPTSPTAPPPFFGARPARSVLGRMHHGLLRTLVNSGLKQGVAMFEDLLAREGIPPYGGSAFDLPVKGSRAVFQVGVPGMDYPRTDWPENFHFVGALVPPPKAARAGAMLDPQKLARYDKLVVVSQGTVDNRDPEKLIAPTLAALRGGPHLVVACTGGRNTAELRQRFAADNVVIEDYIPFAVLLEHADLFVCNGGYGSVMFALLHGIPLLCAGKLEGKNDVNARLAYRGLALDLGTERPSPKRIAAGVARMFSDASFAQNVARVRDELLSYKPLDFMEQAIVAGGISNAMRRAS